MRRLLAGLLVLTGCIDTRTPARIQADRARAHLTPAALPAPGPASAVRRVQTVRLLGDDDVRELTLGWERTARSQVERASAVLESQFGVRLEVVEVGAWKRSGPARDLVPLLHQLARDDGGAGVDLVIGITGASTIVSGNLHDLAMVEIDGRHIVLRAMDDAAEAASLESSLSLLDAEERRRFYTSRKAHKEAIALAHEWGHTQGAEHSDDPSDIMATLYDTRQARFGGLPAEMIELSLSYPDRHRDRSQESRYQEERAALLARHHRAPSPPAPEDPGPAARSGRAVSTSLAPADRERLSAALRGLPDDPEGSWAVIDSVRARAGDDPGVASAVCGAAADPRARRRDAVQMCERAAELALGDPQPRLVLASIHLQARRTSPAIEQLALARTRLDSGQGDPGDWAQLASLYLSAGALTFAEQALERMPLTPERSELAAAALRRRRQLGLPRDATRFNVPPEREPAFVETILALDEDLRAGRRDQVHRGVAAALFRYPEAPALLALECELLLLQGRRSEAARTCDAALAGQDDFTVGLLLAAHATRDRAAAVRHLRRAIDLDPQWPTPWHDLAELHRRAGDRAALRALEEEHRARVGGALP